KPANILLEEGVERVAITDFGLARAIDDATTTRSGVIAGTPQYMSPEQAHGDQLDHRSDLFSLGSVMYFMLTGRSPFRAETTMGVLNRIGHDAPRSLRSINPQVPVWLEDIVLRLLEKNRDQRYQSAQEVAELFGKWLAHLQQPENVSPPSPLAVTSPRDERFQLPTGWKRYLWGGLAIPFVLFAAVLLYIETGKGTLKIENNSNAAVPIRILKNNKTVKELTVSAEGATTRLMAGQYIIEIEGDATEYKLAGNEVTLSRGGDWFARIELSPPKTDSAATIREKSRMGGDVSDAIPDTADWPRFEKTNVADLRRNPNSHPDLDCLIRVDFDSAEGIDWLFSDNPVRREPIGPFCVDNLSGASLAPLIDDDGRRIQMAVKLECGDVKEGIWMCLEGRRIVVDVTQEDFDYVCTGNLLTKVVYLTRGVNDEEFGVLETIASSRLQPGVDPLAEADRRGFPIVSATFSPRPANLNESDRSALREAHGVDAIQNHSAIESVPSLRQLIGGRQLEPLGRYRKKLESAAPIRIAGKRGEVVLRPGQSRLVELPNPVLEFYWNQEGSKPTEGLADFEAFNFVLFEWETNGAFTATAYRSPIHQSLTTGDVEWRQAQSLMNLSLLKQQL
ncbi:MAG: serine/threonine protein kinase, partial [Planctomycetaceae bacterium]|nr:serine/threonine protein kinase [Planctomycetaceae bacterium]